MADYIEMTLDDIWDLLDEDPDDDELIEIDEELDEWRSN